ncbi:MAG: hypothetical protein ACI89X_004344 [Planctomycetota bacterium]|jgi:hypothetical protein
MKVCPALTSLGLAFAIAAPTATGQSRLDRLITQSVENLDTKELRLNCLQRLENLGKLVLPELRKRLHWQKRGDLTRQQQIDLLYVIGTLGKDGTPAMPELLAWINETDSETIDQLLVTLTYLAPHFDQKQLANLDKAVREYRSVQRRSAYRLIFAQVQLGAEPTTKHLTAYLRDYETNATAACRKICANPVMAAEDAQQLTEVLHERLQKVTKRSFISQRRGAASLSGELAEAWLAISGKAPDDVVARGLLTHRRPMQRVRAILWLEENGEELPAEERCDVVIRLWDGDDRVVRSAASTLSKWRLNGALALPALLRLAEQHESPSTRSALLSAAEKVAENFESYPKQDQPWLMGAHAILTGQPATVPTNAPSQLGKRTLAELMMMAQWSPPERLAKLLTFVHESKPDRELVGTIYGWLASTDPPVIDTTLAFLARNAGHAIDIANSVRNDDPAMRWEVFTLYNVPRACRGTAIEATAWFQSVEATTGDFIDMLDSFNTRLQVRGLAELVLSPTERLQPITARLRGLADLHSDQQLDLRFSGLKRSLIQPYKLAEPVRMLAVMALARMGKTAKDQNGLRQLVKKHFACSLDDLPATIAEREKAGGMARQVEVFEAMCRRLLYVPAQLAWPKAKPKL